MKTVEGDIFKGEWDGMVHCANLYSAMNSGIAKSVKARWPKAAQVDVNGALGHFSYCTVNHLGRDRTVFNLYGQVGIGNDGHPMNRNARYDAIHDGVFRICELMTCRSPGQNLRLAFPYRIASDRAGGDWRIVSAILESISEKTPNIEFVIYKL
jgi:hypothetical protein